MSNAINSVIAILVHFGKVAWLEAGNMRREYGELDVIMNSLMARGWATDNPVPAIKDPKSAGAISDFQLKQEMARRQAEWDRLKDILKTNDTQDNQAELHVFEVLYTEDGKLIVPEYSGNAGFRRARSYRGAMVRRYSNNRPDEPKDIKIEIPIRPAFYKNNAERLIDQQLENEMQGVGTKKMEDLEKLAVTKGLFDEGCLEVQIRQLYSSSTGQKVFGICQADANWPPLHIFDRFLYTGDPKPSNFIPWGPVRGADLVKLNAQFEADRKRKEGLPLSNDQRAMEPITEEQANAYFVDKAKTAGDGNATKIMKKGDMEGKAKNHKLLAVRAVMDSVLGNTEANLAPLMDHPDSLNGVFELVKGGQGDFADSLVFAAKAHKDVLVDVIALLQSGKSVELKAATHALLNPPKAEEKPQQHQQGQKKKAG